MLKLIVGEQELYDNEQNVFVTLQPVEITLVHSLVSISKWESKHQISFLSSKDKTTEHIQDYIKCMAVNDDVTDELISRFSQDNYTAVGDYIKDKFSATRFMEMPGKTPGREKVTSELIYYWMIALEIPWEAQYWHLNRLLTLIEVCQRKNSHKNGKMSKSDMVRQRQQMNAARRGRTGSMG